MLGSENIALIFRWKLFPVIEGEFQRSMVRMEDYIRRDDFVFQFRMLTRVPRILMTAHVPPGPAIESAFLHMRDVVRNKIVAQRVALVHRTPQFACFRIDR